MDVLLLTFLVALLWRSGHWCLSSTLLFLCHVGWSSELVFFWTSFFGLATGVHILFSFSLAITFGVRCIRSFIMAKFTQIRKLKDHFREKKGCHSFFFLFLTMMVFPVGMDCVPTGYTIHDPSNFNMRQKGNISWEEPIGKHSEDGALFPFMPFSSLQESRRPRSGEIVDLRARSFWGSTHHVGWGTCLAGSIVTKAHVLQTSTVTVGQEEWSLIFEHLLLAGNKEWLKMAKH